MKKVKLAFWIIILALFGVLIYQNQPYFLTKHSLELNLYIFNRETVPVYNLVIIVAFFAFGLLIAYTSSLIDRFRANKTIKELRAKVRTQQGTLDQVKQDVEILKTPLSKEEEVGITDEAKKDDQGDSSEAQTA
jgi:hypothetical protein